MMDTITIDLKSTESFISPADIARESGCALEALKTLTEGSGPGSDFLGWVRLPERAAMEELARIKEIIRDWSTNINMVIIIGIGGSYLGAKAVIEALSHSFEALLPGRKHPLVLFAGHNMSEDYLFELLEVMQYHSCACVVISKSGITTEPAVSFRLIKRYIEKRYGKEEAKRRIVAITDASKGALRTLSHQEGYRTLAIPDDIGGRFSVLTPAGLLPMAIGGVDVEALIAGARAQMEQSLRPVVNNPSIQYASARNALYKKGKTIEILADYHPKLHYMAEWWKQLFGESEGKEGLGLFPASVNFTTDLHSMGQYIQDGPRILIETVLSISCSNSTLLLEVEPRDLDGLNYLSSRRIDFCNKMAELGTRMAHVAGGVPNIRITIPRLDARNLGALLYFFEAACAISGYMLGINPFDQPGVEAYKKNMFALLRGAPPVTPT